MSHRISRRDFLKIGATGAASTILAGCANPRRWVVLEPFIRAPEEQLAGRATWYASTCRQCPAGCGIIVRLMNGRALKVEGNPEHPLNQGKLCPRGQAELQVLYNPDRLPGPVMQSKRGSRQFSRLSWNEAINRLAGKINEAGSQVAVWLGSTTSGHLYDLFQRYTHAAGAPDPLVFDLYTGFQGYPLVQSTQAQTQTPGGLPGYQIASADMVFSFGADLLGTWLSTTRYGVDFGQMRSQPLGKRGYLVQFESRMTNSGVKADEWVPIRPGTEGLVAQAIARLVADRGLGDAERVARARMLGAQIDVNQAAAEADISVSRLIHLAKIFANAALPVAIPGNALTGLQDAVTAVNSIQALNQIVASGGVTSFAAPPIPDLMKPKIATFGEVQSLIARMQSGQVKMLLVYGTNPVYDLPEQFGLSQALSKVPTVVSFASIPDETAAQADLILPDRAHLESWGYEVVSPNFGLPIIGSQQPVVRPVFDSRATGDVLLTAARILPQAAKALPWTDEVAFLKEMVTKLPPGAFDGSGAEVLWARFLQHGGWWPAVMPSQPPPTVPTSVSAPASAPKYQGNENEYPLLLHLNMPVLLTDGRGASQPWLQGVPEPMTSISWQTWVEINPDTAAKLGLQDNEIVNVTSPYGEITAQVCTYPAIRPDTISIPLGQGHTDYGRYARNRGANPMKLVGAQIGTAAGNLVWAELRVKITPTGKKKSLALFENKYGVTEGFVNQKFPGQ